MAKALAILLHGVGSDGADLAVLGQHWAEVLPDVAFAAPDAPFPFEHAMGFQWFSLTGITPENRPARVRAARDAFDQTLQALMAQHGMAGAWEKVILVGFSQGSIMALDALAAGRYPLAGVVAFSGRLAFDGALTPRPYASALLIHGKADDVIPFSESESAEQRLRAAGVNVAAYYEAATGHTISAQGAMQAAAYIAQCLQD
ncbi:alpha/beta hydrolase [Candidatus Pantoea soli]|uniref:Phospholipase n=1 Tax=Candidatus Pantoea soli TaxID=3098669 RepID=A0A518XGQ1_9GAMM|nr:prolyl oligopeptidase family serine peptidase [Pantoea soli]QDY43375.1 phospholipase [Pantoea soli]